MGGYENMFMGCPGAEYRIKADKYGKLARTLKKKKDQISEQMESEKAVLETSYNLFLSNENSAEGMIISTFDTHVDNWKDEYEIILRNIEAGIDSLEGLIKRAEGYEEFWNQKAEIEERKAHAGF